ncbi:MAG: polysaccharide deacetylase family protein [Myxococcota bacterium]
MTESLAAVNVDVDSLHLYYRIHGLDEEAATNVVWERGVARFAELFDEVGIRATFFVVASDLVRWPEAGRMVRRLAEAGHEIASHTWSHPYDLTRRPRSLIQRELQQAQKQLSDASGRPVVGFRAPGYTMTDVLWELLAEEGYAYDSSLFPCPPYYLAKAAVMGLMRLRGRTSASILDHPSVMWAPRLPHRRKGVLELPISVLPGVRFPFIGTSLLMMGQAGYRVARPLVRRMSYVNLEFHGIDLCDLTLDGIDPTLLKQPDLRVPLERKRDLFRRVLTDLRDAFHVNTLENLAPSFAES